MICDVCGKRGAVVRHVTRCYGHGKAQLLIEGVPVVTCSRCGESYMTADTLHEIERIRLHHRQLAVKRLLPVARFGGAA
jgi:YgiT-type zinc finger domain-containing protein